MGAGKTTVGQRCAELLDRPFVDTDELVEATAGITFAEIFAAEGEAGSASSSARAVADACASPAPLVIACGGGAVLDADNRARAACDGLRRVARRPRPRCSACASATTLDRPLLARR